MLRLFTAGTTISVRFLSQDRHHRGADRQTGQRGVAGAAGPGAGPPHPHQREGGASEGAAVHQPAAAAAAQRRREAGVREEAAGARPAGRQRQPEQGADRKVINVRL